MHKLRTWLLSALIGSTIAVMSSASAFAISSGELINLTNDQRASAGLPSLSVNSALMASSAAKAQDMITRDYWAHYAPDGTSPWFFISQAGYQYTRAGENLAMDFTTDQAVMDAWMNSPEHRANILNPYYKDVGVTVVDGQLLGHETILVVAHYGTPVVQAAPAVATAPINSPPAVVTASAPVPVTTHATTPTTTHQPVVKLQTTKKTKHQPQVSRSKHNFLTSLFAIERQYISWAQLIFNQPRSFKLFT